MKVLIGVDDSSFSQAAVASVAQRTWEAGTQVKIVSAVDTFLYTNLNEESNRYEIARRAVDRAVEVLRNSHNQFELSGEIIEGSPKEVILDEAEKWLADLIVVGSHGRRGLNRFLLGSVSQAVALHANCSVEIVRAPAAKNA
ncbi:MAG: universal stress protein [Acidobacteria bacterium]|nr:universal stress protein [Acidobacteriota bacterium]